MKPLAKATRISVLEYEIQVKILDLLVLARELYLLNGHDHFQFIDQRTRETILVEYKP